MALLGVGAGAGRTGGRAEHLIRNLDLPSLP